MLLLCFVLISISPFFPVTCTVRDICQTCSFTLVVRGWSSFNLLPLLQSLWNALSNWSRTLHARLCSDPLQFAHGPNRSPDDAISYGFYTTLTHLDTGKGRCTCLIQLNLKDWSLSCRILDWAMDPELPRPQVVRLGIPRLCLKSSTVLPLYDHTA